MKTFRFVRICAGLLLCAGFGFGAAQAQEKVFEDKLGAGDTVRIQVFQSPELSLETRIQENGSISYPLIGSVKLAGHTIADAEKAIGSALQTGGFMQKPQVNVTQLQARRKQVSVLGAVNKPGQVALDYVDTRLSDILALVGGIAPTGSDTVIVAGQRAGKPMRQEINIASTYLDGKTASDIILAAGDVVYVHRAPVFYVYGEAQHPGAFRLERNLNFMQALVIAGGTTARGTEKRLRLSRQSADGSVKELVPEPNALVQADDVIFVRESLF
jgi:polysaccharide biosynthesis/export protein